MTVKSKLLEAGVVALGLGFAGAAAYVGWERQVEIDQANCEQRPQFCPTQEIKFAKPSNDLGEYIQYYNPNVEEAIKNLIEGIDIEEKSVISVPQGPAAPRP